MAFCRECGEADQNARFCTKCGEESGNGDVALNASKPKSVKRSAATAGSQSSKSPHTCPSCHSQDAVQRASAVIDAGNSTTQGGAVSFPVLGGGSVTATSFASASTTNLAYRLSPPGQPRARFWVWFLIFLLAFGWLGGLAGFNFLLPGKGHQFFGSDVSEVFATWIPVLFSLFLGALPALGLAAMMRRIGNATWLASTRADWSIRASRVYNAFYCFRDDTMFDSKYHGRPEDFIRNAWNY